MTAARRRQPKGREPAMQADAPRSPAQGELQFATRNLPVPSPGTLIIMRLQDYAAFAGQHDQSAVAVHPVPPGHAMTRAEWEANVLRWLRGGEPPERYSGETRRASDGRVLRTTTGAILRVYPPAFRPGQRAQETIVGKYLNSLGFAKQRRRAFGGGQQYSFVAPMGWEG